MSQVDTQQTRPQSGKQNSPSVGQNGDQKSRPKRQGSGNRQSDENRTPKSRGGDRSGSRRGPRGDKPLNKDSKTIYVGKVFTDDLDGSQIAEKLKEQRIKYLRDVLDQFGPIESFDPQVNDGYVLLTYDNHKSAEDALRTLKNRDEVDTILLRVQDKINQSKLPQAVCPDLHKYRYSWSDKQAPARTTGKGKAAPQLPKTVVAKKVSDQQAPSPTTAQPTQQSQPQQAQQQKPKKGPRKGKEQEEPVISQPAILQPPKPKKGQQQNVQQQAQVTTLSPKTQGADDLQREAERARLTQDLHYLRQQQQHVSQELAAESDRCRARDERIQRLSEELNRVRQQEQFLESQLKAEQNWKQAAEERIVKLTEEVTHFIQEQKQVEKRLTTVEQQLANGL